MPEKVYINFLQFHEPRLDSGKYTISLEQEMHIDDELVLGPLVKSQVLYVQGKRFSLDPNMVHAMFPPLGSRGDRSSTLPHIVLNRSVFPWERSINGTAGSTLPWLALLLFDESENEQPPLLKTITVEDLILSGNSAEVFVPYFTEKLETAGETAASQDKSIDEVLKEMLPEILEPGEKRDDPVTVIDVEKSLLTEILPSAEDLQFNAHVRREMTFDGQLVTRQEFAEKLNSKLAEEAPDESDAIWTLLQTHSVVLDDERSGGAYLFPKVFFSKGLETAISDEGIQAELEIIKGTIQELIQEKFPGSELKFASKGVERAVVLGNRLPKPQGKSVVHLVSLMNCYTDDTPAVSKFDGIEDDKLVRLISLKNWAFSCEDHALDFAGVLGKLDSAMFRNEFNGEANALAAKYLNSGFHALPHQLRIGEKTFSWFRGPLVPGNLFAQRSIDILPVESADRLVVYDRNSGMLDVSYAAAWELGRQMALQDRRFSQDLYQRKKELTQTKRQKEQLPGFAHLPLDTDGFRSSLPNIRLHGHTAALHSLAISGDGRYLLSASADFTVKVWKRNSGQLQFTLSGHSNEVKAACFSPNGERIFTGSNDLTLKIWDGQSGRLLDTISQTAAVNAIAISPDGSRIVMGLADQTVVILDGESFENIHTIEPQSGSFADGHSGSVLALAISPDGSEFLSGSSDQTAKIWEMETGRMKRTLESVDHPVAVNAVAFAPDGMQVAVGFSDQAVLLWAGDSDDPAGDPLIHSGVVQALTYKPDGSQLAVASFDGTIKLWDLASAPTELKSFQAHAEAVTALAFSPDGMEFFSASSDHSIRIWNAAEADLIRKLENHHTATVNDVIYSPDGQRIVSVSDDHQTRIWSVETLELITLLEEHTDTVNGVAYAPDGQRIVTASADGTAIIWDALTFQVLHKLDEHTSALNFVCFSPDGVQILTGSDDSNAKIWDTDSGGLEFDLNDHGIRLLAGVFSPDGQLLATSSEDGIIIIWEAGTGVKRQQLEDHEHPVRSLVFSPDGKFLLSGDEKGGIRMWNTSDGSLKTSFPAFGEIAVKALSFSPDGHRVLVALEDSSILYWNIKKQQPDLIEKEEGFPAPVSSFLMDSRQILMIGDDNSINIDKLNDSLDEEIIGWLNRRNELEDIPFHYLVPKEDLLPEESIRFFKIDPLWIQCLQDGALSLGEVPKSNEANKEVRSFWADPIGLVSGFLLRSEVVSGFPDMQIVGYTTPFNDKINHTGEVYPRIRKKLAPDILLCLFDRGVEIQTVDFFLPPEGLHFGFKEDLSKDLKDLYGHELGSSFSVDENHWKKEDMRILNFQDLILPNNSIPANSLQEALIADANISAQGIAEFAEFTSADFALEMLEGTARVRIAVVEE